MGKHSIWSAILDPILFNIFISDLFLVIKDVDFASYADDNTIYQSGRTVDDVINGFCRKSFPVVL